MPRWDRKPDAGKRDRNFVLRMTRDEQEWLAWMAARAEMTTSDFVRRAIDEKWNRM